MKKIYLITLIFFLLSCGIKSTKKISKDKMRILFIGNSLTYYNDMPDILKNMLLEKGYKPYIEKHTLPGVQLWDHFKNTLSNDSPNQDILKQTKAEQLILNQNWDYIIVQGGTVPVLIPGVRKDKLDQSLWNLKSIIKDEVVIMFETWPSLIEYPKKYSYSCENCSIEINNLKDEVNLIKKKYEEIANKFSFELTDTCSKFYNVIENYKNINLYHDNIHPSKYGAFLNACIFYKILTGKKSSEIKYNGNIEEEKAQILKSIGDAKNSR